MGRKADRFLKGMLKIIAEGVVEAPLMWMAHSVISQSRSVLIASGECEGHLYFNIYLSFLITTKCREAGALRYEGGSVAKVNVARPDQDGTPFRDLAGGAPPLN